jgi:uncharacterized membrane protein required for colicin V production
MGNIDALFSFLAAVLGIAHAVYAYRQEVALFRSTLHDHSIEIRFRACYYALWALALWVVLGPYVVGYWLLALVPYLIARAMGKTLSTTSTQTAR